MAITFDAIPLVNAAPYTPDYQPRTKEEILLSGKSSVQSSTELGYHISFSCFTETYSNVTDLRAKAGAKYSLVDDYGTRNAYISAFTVTKIVSTPDYWRYEVSFIADTV